MQLERFLMFAAKAVANEMWKERKKIKMIISKLLSPTVYQDRVFFSFFNYINFFIASLFAANK